MRTTESALRFFLFDGEGGGDGAQTASTAGPEQGEKERPQIQYGKDPTGNNGPAPSQVGSDNSGEGTDLNAEFAALVGKGGKYHDIYGQMVSGVIQDRFKNQADLQGQVDQISDDLTPLFMNYGLDIGDFEGLKNAVAHDDAFYQAAAEREGLDVNQYKENLRLKAEAERGRQIEENYRMEQAKQAAFRQWETEAAAMQQAFPNFDLGLEIQSNAKFADLLNRGVSVQDAFYLTHMEAIQNGYNGYAQATATQNVVNTIQKKAQRPVEAGAGHVAAVQRKSDPSQLTGEDLDEINRQVAEGGTVAF